MLQKSYFLWLVLFVIWACELNAQTTRVLFIGNSYTGVNNLPGLVQSVALANGDSLIVDSYTPGGWSFEDHYIDQTTINKIYSQQWDFVVLQEQSQKPALSPASVAVWVYPYAEIIDSMIHDNNPCTETIFYMTWGRKNGDATYCPLVPEMCTYEGMQARLRESYLEMALMNNSTVSPVGATWRYMRSLNPAFDLYQADESHPSMHGSYLAACTFYSTIFHKSVVGNTFISTLTQSDAATIQNAVHEVATDSIYRWYEHGNIPMASFSYSTNGNHVQFQNHSLNSLSYLWDFGDGNTSTAVNPMHTYVSAGNYSVTLTVTGSCESDEIINDVVTGATSLSETSTTCKLYESFPGHWEFDCGFAVEELQLFNVNGQMIFRKKIDSNTNNTYLNISDFPAGVYFVKISGKGFLSAGKIVMAN